MQKSHGFLAALAGIFLALPAIAGSPQTWLFLMTEQSGNRFYMDVDTVSRKGAIVSFSTIGIFPHVEQDGTAATGLSVEGNCTHNQIRYVSATSYDSQFNVLFEDKMDRKWKTVKPKTAGYAALRKACEKKKR